MSDWATKAYTEIINSGKEWADKDAAAKYMDEARHSILSECKLEVTDEKSDAARETKARASDKYKAFLIELRAARTAANHARVQWEAAKTLASLRQTQASLKKAEMNLV